MRRPRLALELGFAVLSLAAGTLALAGEPAPGRAAQPTAQGSGAARVNPTRRLEAEIEDYPAPRPATTDDTAARIPEVVEEPAPPRAVAPKRPDSAAGAIDPAQVQRVLGQSATVMPLSALDSTQVTRLQQRLRERGLYLGRIDGIAGPETRAAVKALLRERFALERRLLERGQLTSEFAELVGLTSPRVP